MLFLPRLGPAGTRFAQPVRATVTLGAGNRPAVLLVESNGTVEAAADALIVSDATGRRATGELTHFSYLVSRTLREFTATLELDKRELRVGDEVRAQARLTYQSEDSYGDASCDWKPPRTDAEGGVLNALDTPPFACPTVALVRQEPNVALAAAAWYCGAPGREVISIRYSVRTQVSGVPLPDVRTEFALAADVACTAGEPAPGPVAGVHRLPFGTRPDGLRVYPTGLGLRMWLAIAQGLLVYDLLSGLVEHNLTFSGAGAVGGDNIDVEAIDHGSTSAVFAASGSGGALRNRIDGNWTFTQLLLAAYLDASNAGNRFDAQEMVVTSPAAGLGFLRLDPTLGAFALAPGLSLSNLLFVGNLVSATVALQQAGAGVLALTIGTDANTTSTVWWHGRASTLSPAVPLFSIPDPLGRRLRCAPLPGGRVLCVVTAQTLGKAWIFTFDPAAPQQPVLPLEVPVGAGSVGVQITLGRDGLPVAVVSNFDEGTFNVLRFSAAGAVAGNVKLPLPAGCSRSAHVLLFVYALREWLAGTCFNEDAYFVHEYS